MNALSSSFSSSVTALAWTLLHSLWQGTAAAALLWLLLRSLPSARARLRYALSAGALLLLAATTGTTFLLCRSETVRPQSVVPETVIPPDTGVRPAEAGVVNASGNFSEKPTSPSMANPSENSSMPPKLSSVLPEAGLWMPWLVGFWTLGVLVGLLRLLGSWQTIRHWRLQAESCALPAWVRKFDQLRASLSLSRPIRLLVSTTVPVPMVIGWLKPAVLVPAQLFTGLPAAQLEALLVHELAHIRRHDYLVNLIQSAVEILHFHHPAVWWISSQIRAEREHCCDDTVVHLCGSPLPCAQALAALEDLRHREVPALCPAATGSPLARRIRRLLASSPPNPTAAASLWPALLGTSALLVLLCGLPWLQAQDTPAAPSSASLPSAELEADGYAAGPSLTVPSSLRLKRAREAVTAFLKAPTADAKMPWLLPRGETLTAARAFFERHSELTRAVNAKPFEPGLDHISENGEVTLAMALADLPGPYFFRVHPTAQGPRIDWLSSTYYLQPHWRDIQTDMPETPTTIRAVMRLGDYYNKAFADAGLHRCYELTFPGVERRFYAYEPRGKPVFPEDSRSGEAAPSNNPFEHWSGLHTLQIKYPASALKDPLQVEIVRILTDPGTTNAPTSPPGQRRGPDAAKDGNSGFPGGRRDFSPSPSDSRPGRSKDFGKTAFDDVGLIPSDTPLPAPEILLRVTDESGRNLAGSRSLMGRTVDGSVVYNSLLPGPHDNEFRLPRRYLPESGAVRIEAEGRIPQFRTWESREKIPDEMVFSLLPGPGFKTHVSLPDGKPAPHATIALMLRGQQASIVKGHLLHADGPGTPESFAPILQPRFLTTDDKGDFLLPQDPDPMLLVLIVHQDGVVEIPHSSLREERRTQLKPWARVTFRVLHMDAPGARNILRFSDIGYVNSHLGQVRQVELLTPGEDGRFVLDKVLPGMVYMTRHLTVEAPVAEKLHLVDRLEPFHVDSGDHEIIIDGTRLRIVEKGPEAVQ